MKKTDTEFTAASYYEGEVQQINPALYSAGEGIYHGKIHHALVWPETEAQKEEKLIEGPDVMFAGHSFTGLWDSAYYYFRELSRMAGIRARVAYSYWGGTGIAHYAGLVEGFEERAAQGQKVFDANEHYDFCVFAGNSDEAVSTYSGKVGATDYSQRERMLKGAKLLNEKAKEKGAKTILWVPQAYKYGFFRDMCMKPLRKGNVGDTYVQDGREYILTLTNSQMTEANMQWYEFMAKEIGDNCKLAPVAKVYEQILQKYGDREELDPYLPLGVECGDMGHQNNLGNYIAACVLFGVIYEKSPEGLGVPESHSAGMAGNVSEKQARIVQQEAWEAVKKYV